MVNRELKHLYDAVDLGNDLTQMCDNSNIANRNFILLICPWDFCNFNLPSTLKGIHWQFGLIRI